MPRSKKVKEEVPSATSSTTAALAPLANVAATTAHSRGVGRHKRAADTTLALIDNQKELNGLQLSLWASNNDLDVTDVRVLRKGINLKPGARRLFSFLQKKIGKEHTVDESGKAIMPTARDSKRERINGKLYDSPWVTFTPYEVIKETIGKRHPSKEDYDAFNVDFSELQNQWHIFSMRVEDGEDKHGKPKYRTIEVKSRIILDVATETANADHKRYAVRLHPITTAQLATWFRIYPDDFENRIANLGGNRSPYIRDLAELVLSERDLSQTKRDGYFKRTEETLIRHLRLERYEGKRKAELQDKIDKAIENLTGYLIDKVVRVQNDSGGTTYRIYPVFDPESDPVLSIEPGAA